MLVSLRAQLRNRKATNGTRRQTNSRARQKDRTATRASRAACHQGNKSIATRVLAQIDEEQKWKDLLEAQDVRVRFKVLRYLTDKRDGKPMQRSELSSKGSGVVPVQIITTAILPDP